MRHEIRLQTEAMSEDELRAAFPWAVAPPSLVSLDSLRETFGRAQDVLVAASDSTDRARDLEVAEGLRLEAERTKGGAVASRSTVASRAVAADLVHATARWAYWSDGAMTDARDLDASTRAKPPAALSADAVALLDAVWGSDSGTPRVGWKRLAAVARILVTELLPDPPGLAPEHRFTAYHLRVRYIDGTEGDLYTWEDFHEGEYAVCDTQAELLGVIAEFFESLAIDAAMLDANRAPR